MAVEQIDEITIKGYRSLRDVCLEMTPFTVLIGANGSGKSNFIDFFQMLNYAFGSTNGNLQLYIGRQGKASSLLYYGPQTTRFMEASVKFKAEHQWSKYSFSLSWGAPDELFFAGELLEFQRNHDEQSLSTQLGSGQVESRVLSTADNSSNTWQQQVARVFRTRLRKIRAYHFHDTSEEANIRLTQDLDRDDYLMSNAGNLAVFLHNLQANRPQHYRRILGTIQLVAPYIRDFVLQPQATNDRFILLRLMDRSGIIFGPHQLSDGTLRAIALITALLQPDETMPGIMLFDEPELGLHPTAIGLVASLLKAVSKDRQVIVATQSPLLIRDYEPEDIVVAERQEDQNGRGETTFRRLSNKVLSEWLEDFDLGDLYEKNVTGGYPR